MNKKQYQFDEHLVRSGTRIRESVRCLPRGHFQQIRQMFDRSTPSSSHITRQLPVTDKEQFQSQKKMPKYFNEILLENDQSLESSKFIEIKPLFSKRRKQMQSSD